MSVVFPKLLKGGNHLIAPGIVVPPGMRIRNPALLKPTLFARQLKEILQVWSTTPGGAARDTLGERVAVMWLQYQYFRRVAAFAYGRNKRRTARQTKSFTRFSCCAPNGALVSLKLSPLATLKDVKRAVAAKSAARCPRAARDPRYVVLLDGSPVADALCLEDAGVRASTTLVLTLAAPRTGDTVLAPRALAPSGERRRSSASGGGRRASSANPNTRASFLWSELPGVLHYGPRDRQGEEDLWSRPTTATDSHHGLSLIHI